MMALTPVVAAVWQKGRAQRTGSAGFPPPSSPRTGLP